MSGNQAVIYALRGNRQACHDEAGRTDSKLLRSRLKECRTDPAEEPSILVRGERIAVYLVEECSPYTELIELDAIEIHRVMARIDRCQADNAAKWEVHAVALPVKCRRFAEGGGYLVGT